MLSNNEQNERKSRIAALAGTILFHGLILAVLLLFAFRSNHPLPVEEGVEVNLDYAYLFKGNPGPEFTMPLINPTESLFSGLTEGIPDTQKKKNIKPTPSKGRISIVETPDEATIIYRKPYSDKISKISAASKSNPLKAAGTTPSPELSDEISNMISYDLGGRAARILPKPTFNSSEDGMIVVSVKVNIHGIVTSANAAAKGTTIAEPSLRRQAENAARISLFAPDTDAPEEQRGTITYVLVKKK